MSVTTMTDKEFEEWSDKIEKDLRNLFKGNKILGPNGKKTETNETRCHLEGYCMGLVQKAWEDGWKAMKLKSKEKG